MLGGLVISGMETVDYAENGTGMVAMYTAFGPDAASAMWSLEGDDAGQFSITNGGMLTFKSAPDYENAAGRRACDNMYMVTVNGRPMAQTWTHERRGGDGHGRGGRYYARHR